MRFIKTLLISLTLLVQGIALDPFNEFIQKYNKEYETIEEYFHRKFQFSHNLDAIEDHNSKNNWKLGINKFTDLSHSEFQEFYTGLYSPSRNHFFTKKLKIKKLPTNFDWVKEGAVTDVKNQEKCGSCWAFSTTGSLEGLEFLQTKNLIPLSEQQLVDCSSERPNNGCKGGLMDIAINHATKEGICSEEDYPYTATDGVCQKNCTPVFKPTDYQLVVSNNESQLLQALSHQPISVAIQADLPAFQFYSNGIMDGRCGTNLDHGVLLVGWGVEDNIPYWKVKNSWGEEWGENGYIRLIRNTKDTRGKCGIAMEPVYPI